MKTNEKIYEIIQAHAQSSELSWLSSQLAADAKSIAISFVKATRFITKTPIITHIDIPELSTSFQDWTLDRLVRVYLLIHVSNDLRQLNLLFDTAELQESVALHSALPLFDSPEQFMLRATDAVRSNIGPVFDAIAFGNPYPSKYFSEAAWNQLVLKCIFNDKPIHNIVGLMERKNKALLHTLIDFAKERWAADRRVPAQVWRLSTGFPDVDISYVIAFLTQSMNPRDQIAAKLIQENTPNWSSLEMPEQIYNA